MLPPRPPAIVVALLAALQRLRQAVVGSIEPSDRGPRIGRMAAAFLWLDTVMERIARLAVRHAEGRLRPLRPRPAQADAPPRAPRPKPKLPRIALPRQFGWLARELERPDALIDAFAARLADPAFQSFLQAEPARFGRLLRPVCHAFGLTPPGPIREPAPNPTAKARAEPKPEPERERWSWPRRGDPETDALSPKIG